jgi:hypothetical protein|tara:strand:+ start:108 stop:323 length:216 start_codon:yes stop_codon:yes gene_type:complete
MTYKSKVDFIKNHNVRKLGIVEYCLGLEKQGLTEEQIQAKMIVDRVSKSPRSVQDNFSFYKKVSKQLGWVK